MEDKTIEERNLNEMAAMLGEHQVTDDSGNFSESETLESESAPEDQKTPEEDSASVEKPAEDKPTTPQGSGLSDAELAEDESGKRYVPESRFKEIYAKAKAAERELETFKSQTRGTPQIQAKPGAAPQVDRTESLEIEFLKSTLPQFNPESQEYDPDLDELGFQIKQANPSMTRIEAAKKALSVAHNLATKRAGVVAEARAVKSLQSDQGITNRVAAPKGNADLDSMSADQMERYMKEHGQW